MAATGSDVPLELDIRLVDGPVEYQPPPFIANGGGENSFLGRTRAEDNSTHGPLLLLRYEAKRSMALKELEKLAREAAEKYGLLYVRIVHSIGDVKIAEASVLVQVVGIHRKESFEASVDIMDRLKKRVPIWKQELWQDGATWKDGAVVQPSA
mmetsp:Transcript_71975/g.116693  ORF Transcript_71975/g.116693 Transcript_71975/m.116693 type:complete len:153 (-) Transcript_71975:30-488(-)